MDKIQHKDKELDYLTRSLLHHPSPYIIYELDGSIAWANMAAIYIFELDQLNDQLKEKIETKYKNVKYILSKENYIQMLIFTLEFF